MESIGQFLKQSRESRGLSVEQVSRDTNISKHYIVGLEEDQHEVFPAEPYIIGFLRNYSDYLGLNTEDLINNYRTLKIQEQPAPLTELIRQPSPWPKRVVWGTLVAAAAVVLVVFVAPPLVEFVANLPKAIAASNPAKSGKLVGFPQDKSELTQRFQVADQISVPVGEQTYTFQIKSIGAEVVLASPSGENKMHLGDEYFVDLDGNSQQDYRFFLKDLNAQDPTQGAEFTIERLKETASFGEGPAVLGNELTDKVASEGGLNSNAAPTLKTVTILEDSQARPFTLDVNFRNSALFRYVVDDNRREETYFKKGENVRIEAGKRVKIWISNAGAFSGRVNNQADFEIGRNGEVSARVIEWTKDGSGKTILVANPMN